MTIIVFPHPVSANKYWRSAVPKGWTRAVTYPSAEAKAYKEEVGWLAKVAGFKAPTDKPVALTLVLCPRLFDINGKRTGVVMDLGNCWKVAEDALQGIVYVNDRQVKKICMEYGEKTDRGQLIVDVKEFVPAPAPLFARAS